jgi:hypothetical protein
MLYMIKYTRQSDMRRLERFVKGASSRTDAVKSFMNEFFVNNPDDKVKLEGTTEIELTGEMAFADEIENALVGGE